MYDYRRMSLDERKLVVQERRRRGFPLHQPPHLRLGPGWYFVTAATFEHRQHFSTARELSALEDRLLEACDRAKANCAGWVVMPNHYHILIDVPELASLGRCLGTVHGRSSIYPNRRDGKKGRKVWFKYSDRKIRSERHFWTCLHYIVMNPAKHGFTDEPFGWPWSCIHQLLDKHQREWVEDLQRDYPLLEFGQGWDDYRS